MAKCKYCKGKGVYIVKETYSDGDEALVPYECNHCHGTGEDQEDNPAGETFSIGDEDDDEDDN